MLKFLPLFIGWRYIRSRRQNGFISFISLFTFIAMALGVAVLIVVLSVMNGFEREIRQRLLTVLPHITITNTNGAVDWHHRLTEIQGLAGVRQVAPYVSGYGMMTAYGRSQPIKVQGTDPVLPMFDVQAQLIAGDMARLEPGAFGVVLGDIAARRLGVLPGDRVRLTLPQATVTPMGLFPRERAMTVVGIFRVGADVDASHAFIHIQDAARLYRVQDGIHGLQVQLANPMAPLSVANAVSELLGGAGHVTTWETEQATLFQAMRMEKVVVSLLLTIIIVVAAFNIVANLVLMVADKRKDIAVLRTLGCSAGTIMAIFVVQGLSVGFLGILLGAVLGAIAALVIGDVVTWFEGLFGFQVFDASIYFISQLPSDLRWPDMVWVVLVALLLSILATLYPAWRAGRIHPAEVLRYHQ